MSTHDCMKTTKRVVECSICASSSKKWSTCPYCEFKSCRPCAQRYVLDEPTPKCMNCRKEWSREIQNRELTAAFVKGPLKKHMEDVLFDSQRALLPASLEIYEREQVVKRAHKEANNAMLAVNQRENELGYNIAREKLHELMDDRDRLHRRIAPNQDMIEMMNRLIVEQHDVLQAIEEDPVLVELQGIYQEKAEEYQRLAYDNDDDPAENNATPTPRFVRACPANNCRGFLNTHWRCGLCDLWTCPDCLVVKGPERDCEHTCNPDDVASASMVAKDSKPCPKCACVIFKIDGCDQMWCTMCHTAFSWRTGQIETSHIHNPHYFEYQRKQNAAMPRAVGDIPCGRELDLHTIRHTASILHEKGASDKYITHVLDYIRNAIHMQSVEVPFYRPDLVANFHPLRVKYLTSQLTESEFRASLGRCMKRTENTRAVGEVIQMLAMTFHEILFRFIREIELTPSIEEIMASPTLNEVDNLYAYANECLLKIAKVYSTLPFGVRLTIGPVFAVHRPLNYVPAVFRIHEEKKKPDTNASDKFAFEEEEFANPDHANQEEYAVEEVCQV